MPQATHLGILQEVDVVSEDSPLTKVVLARETHITLRGSLSPAALLAAVGGGGGGRQSYRLMLQMKSDEAFVACTPE